MQSLKSISSMTVRKNIGRGLKGGDCKLLSTSEDMNPPLWEENYYFWNI